MHFGVPWDELGNEPQDTLKKERQLLRTEVALLKDTLAEREEVLAGEAMLQEDVGDGVAKSGAFSP